MEPDLKWCKNCDELKDVAEFHKNGRGGLMTICKTCRSATRTDFKNYPPRDEKYDLITLNDLIRFSDLIEPDEETGCLNWIGATNENGYGSFFFFGRVASHRFAAFAGQIIDDLDSQVHHTCFNRSCVSVNHLVAVTPEEHRQIHAEQRRKNKKPTARERLNRFGRSKACRTYGQKLGDK